MTTIAPTAETGLVFTLAPHEGRTPAPLNVVGEETLVKVSPADSGGALAAFHLVAPPMSGPPRHVHSREDEWFYVLEESSSSSSTARGTRSGRVGRCGSAAGWCTPTRTSPRATRGCSS
jgi:hypothetical protein